MQSMVILPALVVVGPFVSKPPCSVSIFLPVRDEVHSLPRLCSRIRESVAGLSGGWEVVFFVDDGSSNGSEEILGEMAERADRRMTAVPLRGGFGKSAADPPGASLHEVS